MQFCCSRVFRRYDGRNFKLFLIFFIQTLGQTGALLPPFFFTNQLLSPQLASSSSSRAEITASVGLGNFFPSPAANVSRSRISPSDTRLVIPFVIEKVNRAQTDDYKEISAMCIEVFFKEGTITSPQIPSTFEKNGYNLVRGMFSNKSGLNGKSVNVNTSNNSVNPFLSMNLAFLRNAQYGDLTTRKFNYPSGNDMFVAREVVPYTPSARARNRNTSFGTVVSPKKNTIYNAQALPVTGEEQSVKYMSGEVIGFVEVTARQFALGKGDDYNDTGRLKQRPVLANLAVKKSARGSGVGSKLVQRCEEAVTSEWDPSYDEIILQVEDCNAKAQAFYEKRGYIVEFSDPASRTYDTTGFFPKQVRTTKLCMRKSLSNLSRRVNSGRNLNGISKMFQTLKEALEVR